MASDRMTRCQHCHATTQLYLCDNCQIQLANMCAQLSWLIDELDARIQKFDRIGVGTIGRNRRPDELNVMDFDAAETARKVRKVLLHWVETIAVRASGRPPASLTTASTQSLARWLETKVEAIARLDLARKNRHPLYDDIAKLAGQPTDPQGGQLVKAINRTETHAAGPCPTITGRNRDGTPRQCGQMLFADTYDHTTTCPTCNQNINVEENRKKAAADRDLHTKTSLLEVLTNIDEAVSETQVDRWIEARRLRPRGYVNNGVIIEFRLLAADEPVYSVERARKLRRRDNNLRTRQRRRASA